LRFSGDKIPPNGAAERQKVGREAREQEVLEQATKKTERKRFQKKAAKPHMGALSRT